MPAEVVTQPLPLVVAELITELNQGTDARWFDCELFLSEARSTWLCAAVTSVCKSCNPSGDFGVIFLNKTSEEVTRQVHMGQSCL